jgi:hypothetical protein
MGWSPQIHAGFHGPGVTWEIRLESDAFRVQDHYLLWCGFPTASPTHHLCNSIVGLMPNCQLPLPRTGNAIRLGTGTVWPLPSSLAATKGVAVAFLSSGY